MMQAVVKLFVVKVLHSLYELVTLVVNQNHLLRLFLRFRHRAESQILLFNTKQVLTKPRSIGSYFRLELLPVDGSYGY